MYRMQRHHSHRTDKHCSRSVQMHSAKSRSCSAISHTETHRRAHKENTLTAKESEIFQLKTRKEEMDNYHVLEIENNIEQQKKRQIAQMQAEIRAMGEHLEHEHRACLAMEADVCTHQEQIAQIMQENKRLAFRTH